MDVNNLREMIYEIPELVGKRIVVVGSGYVGLPLAVLRALQGATVEVVDIDEEKIRLLNEGIPPFHEDGLAEFLAEAIELGRISFHTDLGPLVKTADAIIGCVGTPPNPDGSANLNAIFAIGRQIGHNMGRGQKLLVVQTSTVPPGTSRKLYHTILDNLPRKFHEDVELVVADRPEFLQQGYAFRDNLDYDRKVAAVFPVVNWAKRLLMEIEHTKETAPFLWVDDLETAEMVKYAANALLAVKISFANEISRWADAVTPRADVTQVMDAIGLDKRIARWGLNAGLGFGGGCFPKDTSAAVDSMAAVGVESQVVAGAMTINRRQVGAFVNKIVKYFKGDLAGKVIACGGVTFKPDTDFIYPSQAYEVIKRLLDEGAIVRVYDPVGLDNLRETDLAETDTLVFAESVDDMLLGADAYALLTEWPELRKISIAKLQSLSNKVIFDGRNAMDKNLLMDSGFEYHGLGR